MTTDAGKSTSTAGDATTATEHDRNVVAWQIGREPRALHSIAARCVFGFPAVTRQSPQDEDGRPFPTAYYVTCPHLTRQIDRIESDGGVRRFESHVSRDGDLAAATTAAHRVHASIQGHGHRIAAAGDDAHLKCLHAHAAFALAGHEHPVGEAVLREAAPTWCSGARCAVVAGTTGDTSN